MKYFACWFLILWFVWNEIKNPPYSIDPLSYGRHNKLSLSSHPSVSLLSLSVLVLYSLLCAHLCMWTACSSFMFMVQVFWADGSPDILKDPRQFWGTTVIWNVRNYLPSDTVWHPKRFQSLVTREGGPHSSQFYVVCVWHVRILWHWSIFQTLVTGGFCTDVYGIYEVCHSHCVCENWKGYVVKHNCII